MDVVVKLLRSVGTRFLIRLVLRAYERIVDELIENEFRAWRDKYHTFFAKRGFSRVDVLFGFRPGFNELHDAYNFLAFAIRGKRIASSSMVNALSKLVNDDAVVYVTRRDVESIVTSGINTYIDEYVASCTNVVNRDSVFESVHELFRNGKIVGRSVIITRNAEAFDLLFAGAVDAVTSTLRNGIGDQIRDRVLRKIDDYDLIVDGIVDVESSLGCI